MARISENATLSSHDTVSRVNILSSKGHFKFIVLKSYITSCSSYSGLINSNRIGSPVFLVLGEHGPKE